MSKTETLLLIISLACNMYLLIAHHRHVWMVNKFNTMQMEINDVLCRSIEHIFNGIK